MNDSLARVLFAAIIPFMITLAFGPWAIGVLQKLKLGQRVRGDGPTTHLKKSGVPTMGGIIILTAMVVGLLVTNSISGHVPVILLVVLSFGAIGLTDDLLKILSKSSLGLKARHKIIAQIAISLLAALYVARQTELGLSLAIPFFSGELTLSLPLYVALTTAVITGTANAVNFTDGLDGLAAGAMSIASFVYVGVGFALGSIEIAVFAAAVIGSCLGFSWFNAHPAQVIMGDTGSLGLGAALGMMAVFTRTSLILPIIGGLFVLETLSIIIQVTYFRISGGRRVFRMAPLHHHFELHGWAEPKVMIRFWLVGFLFAALGVLAMF